MSRFNADSYSNLRYSMTNYTAYYRGKNEKHSKDPVSIQTTRKTK